MLHPSFEKYLPQVQQLFQKHKIKNAYAFGSVVTDRFKEDSDVDLLINFMEGLDPLEMGQSIWDLEDELNALLKREVDILTERSLKNRFFIKELNETRVPIYG